ncbi:MAG TPA: DNA recombination protein RmuC [Candidatus Acidoferrum sp.]|nr:DNA recombination protein RmuC [Candidatus Acidoferrum sp.]
MTISLLVTIVLAFVSGFFVAWLVASSRANRLSSESAATAAQLSETRQQLAIRQTETDALRRQLIDEKTQRTRAEGDAQNQRANLEEQKRLLGEAEANLRQAFDSLASKALQRSTDQFLLLAQERLAKLQQETSGDLSQRQEAIKGLVEPLQQRLSDLQSHLRQMESSRESAYGELRNQVQQLAATNHDLRKETGTLVSTLKQPQVKGRWGELTLRRAIELAGMSPYCDFDEQVSVHTDEGRLRPDVVVRLPRGANVVVDAKVPLHGFLRVVAAQNDVEREAGLAEHVRLVRAHVNQLSSKEYWKQFQPCPDFVVLFVPGESFFSAALERDPALLDDSIASHVLLASPANLIAILKAVAYGWRQEQIAENAQQISDLGSELYYRILKFLEHMAGVRGGIERTNKAFNDAVGSLEGRVLPAARKLKEKGGYWEEFPAIEPTETALRALNPAMNLEEK